MTPEQRLDKIELMLTEMQIRIDTLNTTLEGVSLQLSDALARIELLEKRDEMKKIKISMQIFKERLN